MLPEHMRLLHQRQRTLLLTGIMSCMFASVPFDPQVSRVMWRWAEVDGAHTGFTSDLRNTELRKSQSFKGATSKHSYMTSYLMSFHSAACCFHLTRSSYFFPSFILCHYIHTVLPLFSNLLHNEPWHGCTTV